MPFEEIQNHIELARLKDLDDLILLFQTTILWLHENGNFQWTKDYPSREIIQNDIINQNLFILKYQSKIIACITIDTMQPDAYKAIPWSFYGNPICIHRLVVHPNFGGNGIGYQLCLFAEEYGKNKGFSVIRLDSFGENKISNHLYKNKLGYHLLENHPINVNGTAFCSCFEKKI